MSKGYGQFCPLAKAAELLCERWTMILVRELTAGSRRFNDLRRGDVRSLTVVWLCHTTLAETRRRRAVEVMGDERLGDQLPSWLQGSPLARLGEMGPYRAFRER